MTRIVVRTKVDANGVLHLAVPLDVADANRDVRVTVELADPTTWTADEWRRGILETAGKWQGDFERPDQGDYEPRESLS